MIVERHTELNCTRAMFQGGCDASIMIEGSGKEMDAGGNFGVKRLDIINSIKADMEDMCPLTVSCADIIAMAGRDAVEYRAGR